TGGPTCSEGVDYVNTGGSVNFADGDSSPKTVNVTICSDAVFETDETFYIEISEPTGGALLGTPSNASVTIISADPVLQFGSQSVRAGEASLGVSIPVTRTGGSQGAVSAA